MGMNGVVGLRYEALELALGLEQIPSEDWPDVIDGVQIMEYETLRIRREQR
jgi:hypothetical protein